MPDPTPSTWALPPIREPVDRDVSLRIDVLRVILIGMIVVAHGSLGLLTPTSPPLAPVTDLLVATLYKRLEPINVPLFFVISGFLFLRKAELSFSAYRQVLVRKCLAFFLCYLFFNGIVAVYLYGVGSLDFLGSWGFMVRQGFWRKLLGLGTMPINTPLWFLRDLIEVFAASPILLFFLKECPKCGLWLLAGGWLVMSPSLYTCFGVGFLFYLGGYVARTRLPLSGVSWWQRIGFWIVIVATAILVPLMPQGIYDFRWWNVPNKIFIFLGLIFFWRLSAFPWIRDNRVLHRCARQSFFIYLIHEPVLGLLQAKILAVWQPTGDPQQLVFYLGTGLGTIVLLWGVAEGLSRVFPRGFAMITGAWRKSSRPPYLAQLPTTK